MQRLNSEIEVLKLENTRLRSDFAKLENEFSTLKLNLQLVKQSREALEFEKSQLLLENEELRKRLYPSSEDSQQDAGPSEPAETPIMSQKKRNVHWDDEEVEINTMSGSDAHSDFISSWKQRVSIVESTNNCVVLKNNHYEKSVLLDDYVFLRTVDGAQVVAPTPLPSEIIIPPQATLELHSNHPAARNVHGKSVVLHRIPDFGDGKVVENRLLDEDGKMTAEYVLCKFH